MEAKDQVFFAAFENVTYTTQKQKFATPPRNKALSFKGYVREYRLPNDLKYIEKFVLKS